MTETPESYDETSPWSAPAPPPASTTPTAPTAPTAPSAPTASPTNFSSYGEAPTPPPLAPQHQPDGGRRKRPARTVAGVVLAVILIGAKLALAVGATHLLTGRSGPIVIVIIVVLIVFGFLSRFMRL